MRTYSWNRSRASNTCGFLRRFWFSSLLLFSLLPYSLFSSLLFSSVLLFSFFDENIGSGKWILRQILKGHCPFHLLWWLFLWKWTRGYSFWLCIEHLVKQHRSEVRGNARGWGSKSAFLETTSLFVPKTIWEERVCVVWMLQNSQEI